ncbi:MAG: phosphomannomutase/phosphoglucomutase [Candidatus Peregrinibacteria bacterium]
MIDPHIFRAYDIRGRAFEQIDEAACRLIGQAFGTELRRKYSIDRPRVVTGRDARTHSQAFEKAAAEGLMAAGCAVSSIGQTPSPVSYFTICRDAFDGSVQITASHNAAHDNGLKLQIREAEAFSGKDLQRLRVMIERKDFLTGKGSFECIDGIGPYIHDLSTKFAAAGKGLKIVVDNGNGVTGPVYNTVLKNVGCTLEELYSEPDGTFPHHLADPSKHTTLTLLQERVRQSKADLGIAFDGDGDRVGFADETGAIRSADEILLLLAADLLSRHPGSSIIYTISMSGILETEIRRLDGTPVMCRVGHSFVEHEMRRHSSLLGGEQSGHFFCFENYFGFDDALRATLGVLSVFSAARHTAKKNLRFSGLFSAFPKVYLAPERRPHCPDSEKTRIVGLITDHFAKHYPVNTLDGVRIDFGDGAWAGIRQSNTSPCLSVCIEARSPEKLRDVEKIVLDELANYPEIVMEK